MSREPDPHAPRWEFWQEKLNSNVRRDQRNEAALEDMGWKVLVVWECEMEDRDQLAEVVTRFPGPR